MARGTATSHEVKAVKFWSWILVKIFIAYLHAQRLIPGAGMGLHFAWNRRRPDSEIVSTGRQQLPAIWREVNRAASALLEGKHFLPSGQVPSFTV
jgi:hypothetical protein